MDPKKNFNFKNFCWELFYWGLSRSSSLVLCLDGTVQKPTQDMWLCWLKFLFINAILRGSFLLWRRLLSYTIFFIYFFHFRGEKRIHLRTLCGTRPKQYPLNSKLPPSFWQKVSSEPLSHYFRGCCFVYHGGIIQRFLVGRSSTCYFSSLLGLHLQPL